MFPRSHVSRIANHLLHQFRNRPGEWFASYWLDQTQHGLVYVALLVDGKVADFGWVRRD